MKNYNNYADLLRDLIGGGNFIAAETFSGADLGNKADYQEEFWNKFSELMTKEGNLKDTGGLVIEDGWLNNNGKGYHWFIRENDIDSNKDSVMGYIAKKADRGFLPTDFDYEHRSHWNDSVDKLVKLYCKVTGKTEDDTIATQVENSFFHIRDIINADAGNAYGRDTQLSLQEQHLIDNLQWVCAWMNIDGESYKQVRNVDAIVPVLNSNHQTQFTRPNFNFEDIYDNTWYDIISNKDIIMSHYGPPPDMDNDGFIDATDASYVSELDYEDLTEEESLKLNFYGEGIVEKSTAVDMILEYYSDLSTGHYRNWKEYLFYTRYKDLIPEDSQTDWYDIVTINEYIRLIMPKYLRRVEVEDLNRNFWVIGQTLSALGAYLCEPNSPLNNLFRDMLDEILQLWQNIIYLWVAAAMTTQELLCKDIQIISIPVNNTIFQSYLKYDNFEQSKTTDSNNIKRRLQYLVESYPKSNLIIVPEIREKNYKHNYYAKSIYQYIIVYNRNNNNWQIYNINSPISIDLTNINTPLGKINKKEDMYYYTNDTSNTAIKGIYYTLLRPEINFEGEIGFDNDNNISFENVTLKINFHDIASKIAGVANDKAIEVICSFNQGEFIPNIQMNDVTTNDTSLLVEQGFYKGELISYYEVVN